ncbi:MAG: glycosyl hydrolase family 18 protein [Streptosporangiaceae bacterium]
MTAAVQVAPEKLLTPPKRKLKRATQRHRPLIVALAVIVVIAATATLISVRLDASPRPSGAPPLDIPAPSTSQLAQVAASSAWPTTAPDSAPASCKQVSLKGAAGASVVSYLDDNTSQHSLMATEAKGLNLLNFSWTSLASPTRFIASDSFAPSLATELTAANQSGPCGLRFATLSDNDPAMSHSDDVRMMTKVLTSSSVRQAHVLAVAQWMAGQPLATGLTIDYENGLPQNLSDLKIAEQVAGWSGLSLDQAVNRLSDDYTQLIGEIATAMHRQHRTVRLMAPVRYSDDVDAATTDIAPYLLNYGALAQYVDQIVLKAYDFNYATGNPGPIAPFADVAKVLTYVHSYNVPWSKLAVIEPLYAYNWTVNKSGGIALSASGQPISATTLNATQVTASQKQWHKEKTENGETEYTYTQSGQQHIVWDAASALKTEMTWLKRNYPQIGIDASTIGNADPTGSALAVTVLGS